MRKMNITELGNVSGGTGFIPPASVIVVRENDNKDQNIAVKAIIEDTVTYCGEPASANMKMIFPNG